MSGPRMMRACELPFEVPEELATAIDEYVDAIESDDWQWDMYWVALHQCAGLAPRHKDKWLQERYLHHGWENGLGWDGDIWR